ncbi:EamA family transporter [Halorientalis marina]|uniref:EamA family transporter n=1 Tax=Halorientalis marina TaxID=2931976 RepID=UPI001FF28CC5|nr:EamA family transporter [Halorientalis marina]
MRATILKLFLITIINAVGQVALKLGAEESMFNLGMLLSPQRLIQAPYLFVGGGLYALSLALYVNVLSETPLSVAYPFIGFTYVIVVIMSVVVLEETITTRLIIGSVLIFLGVSLVGSSLNA